MAQKTGAQLTDLKGRESICIDLDANDIVCYTEWSCIESVKYGSSCIIEMNNQIFDHSQYLGSLALILRNDNFMKQESNKMASLYSVYNVLHLILLHFETLNVNVNKRIVIFMNDYDCIDLLTNLINDKQNNTNLNINRIGTYSNMLKWVLNELKQFKQYFEIKFVKYKQINEYYKQLQSKTLECIKTTRNISNINCNKRPPYHAWLTIDSSMKSINFEIKSDQNSNQNDKSPNIETKDKLSTPFRKNYDSNNNWHNLENEINFDSEWKESCVEECVNSPPKKRRKLNSINANNLQSKYAISKNNIDNDTYSNQTNDNIDNYLNENGKRPFSSISSSERYLQNIKNSDNEKKPESTQKPILSRKETKCRFDPILLVWCIIVIIIIIIMTKVLE